MWGALVPFAALLGHGVVPDPQDREARVLAILSDLVLRGGSGQHSRYQFTEEPAIGGTFRQPHRWVFCANSCEGTFDDGEARRLGRELCEAYGLYALRDVELACPSGKALLDGYDQGREIGFKLRGRGRSGWHGAAPEHPDTELTDEEAGALIAQGTRIYAVDVSAFERLDGDEFTPTVAFLVGLADFLNASTAGEDVELGSAVYEREACWRLPDLDVPEGAEIRHDEVTKQRIVAVERRATIQFACRGLADLQPHVPMMLEDFGVDLLGADWDRDAPVLLKVPLRWPREGQRPTVRVLQDREEGAPWSFAARTGWLLVPRGLALERPFRLEVELEPGSYSLGTTVRIGVAAKD